MSSTEKEDKGIRSTLPIVLFFVSGAFWIALMALGGGVYLFWAALTSILSGMFLLLLPKKWITGPFITASSLFGVVLTIYQLILALSLIGGVLGTVALYNTGLFAVFTVVYGYLLFHPRAPRARAAG